MNIDTLDPHFCTVRSGMRFARVKLNVPTRPHLNPMTAGLARWIAENGFDFPIVRAQTYGRVWPAQEAYQQHSDDPRRPVAMRGSLAIMAYKYCRSYRGWHPNGFAEAIAKRYLRRVKYTCVDRAQHFEAMDRLEARLSKKFPLTHHAAMPSPHCEVWIGGRPFRAHEEQRGRLKKALRLIRRP